MATQRVLFGSCPWEPGWRLLGCPQGWPSARWLFRKRPLCSWVYNKTAGASLGNVAMTQKGRLSRGTQSYVSAPLRTVSSLIPRAQGRCKKSAPWVALREGCTSGLGTPEPHVGSGWPASGEGSVLRPVLSGGG